jgi:hypothetical protein
MSGQVGRRRWYWSLLAVILLAFGLRAYDLGRKELWFDEAVSASIASRGLAGIISYTQNAPFEHPPLYYLGLHLWTQVAGSTEFALRYFSVFWGVLLSPLLYRFTTPWGGRRLALLTSLLAAVSVTYLIHSHLARMYTLLPFLGTLSLLCFFRGLSGRRHLWWLAYFFTVGAGVATHYYFTLLMLVPVGFLILSWPRYRRLLGPFLAIHVGAGLLILAWLYLSEGPRQAILQIVSGDGYGVSNLELRVGAAVGGLFLEEPASGHLALGVMALIGVAYWPLPRPTSSHPVSLFGPRRFLMLWLMLPWLAALAIPYWVQDRHLAFLWPALYALTAGGLLVLRTRSRALFMAGLLLVGVTSAYGLHLGVIEVGSEFGRIMTYIEDRALHEDLVIMNQPDLWPLAGYYSHRDLDKAYVRADAEPHPEESVDRSMRSLVQQRSRVWLGPIGAWNEDPESLVEKWLATYAFQAHKEWFAGSGSAALYFMPEPLEVLRLGRESGWEGGIRLLAARTSPRVVAPADAVRLAFTWQADQSIDFSHQVSLYLVDEDGSIWAERHSEPCSGWCPTDTWGSGAVVQDHHALLVPLGTPPGRYRIQVGWYSTAEGRELGAGGGGQRVELLEIDVVRPEEAGIDAAPLPVSAHAISAEFGGLVTLLGFDLAGSDLGAGENVMLVLHWLAQNPASVDYMSQLELVDRDGQVSATWDRPPVAAHYPTSTWRPGEYLRRPLQLTLPGAIAPGRYQLRMQLLDSAGKPIPLSGSRPRQALGGLIHWRAPLGGTSLVLADVLISNRSVRSDRTHVFDVPASSTPLHVELDQHVELLGYELRTADAIPGGQIELTLYWRGSGATDRPFKVFAHLGDGIHLPVAQHDSPPGGGCCPTDTWVEGEVVTDQHVIVLAADVSPATYSLTVGMYDESSGQRLRILDGNSRELSDEQILIGQVVVDQVKKPQSPVPESAPAYRVFLPFVQVGW